MSKRTLFVGDVHGCYTELKGLLEMANFKPDSERLFFVGDLINRGPKSLEVLKLDHRLSASCVLGNHERSFLKHLKKVLNLLIFFKIERGNGRPYAFLGGMTPIDVAFHF